MSNSFKPGFAEHGPSAAQGIIPEVLCGPESIEEKKARFIPRQKTVDAVIRKRVYASMAVGFVPGPFADMAALSAVQLEMLFRLSRVYNVPFEAEYSKKVLACLASNLFSALIAANIVDVTRYMPFIGKGIATGIANGAATYAVGYAFAGYFTYGSNFNPMDMSAMAEDIKARYGEAKVTVRSWLRKGAFFMPQPCANPL